MRSVSFLFRIYRSVLGPVSYTHLGAHDVTGFLRQAQHGVEAVEDLPVVHPDLEPLQSQGGEGLVDDGGDLRLIDDGEPAISDDVDVRLIELPEACLLYTSRSRWASDPGQRPQTP